MRALPRPTRQIWGILVIGVALFSDHSRQTTVEAASNPFAKRGGAKSNNNSKNNNNNGDSSALTSTTTTTASNILSKMPFGGGSSSVSTSTAGLLALGGFVVGSVATSLISGSNNKRASFPATQGVKPAEPPIAYPEYDYENDPKGSFLKVCEMLIQDLTGSILPQRYDMPEREVNWLSDMLDYNVKGGKMNRGLMVVDAGVAILKNQGKRVTNDDYCRLAVLGWAIEWLQAWLLVADDIMDSSVTRRGQPCWYKKLEQIWYIAINDAVTIEALTFQIMKRHFAGHPNYVQLLDLMMETTLQTEMGQLSDTLCDVLELKDLTPERWQLIVTYKTSFYSFYLSVAFAMTYANVQSKPAYDAAREILVTMGVYFQAQDDYLDCFGTPEQIGKIGTDIQDKKCGWLFTKAYHQLANAEQKAFLDKHYGNCKVGSSEELKIKALYEELGLKKMYADYEQESYDKIMNMKGSKEGAILAKVGVPWDVFEVFLQKVYKRSK